MLVYGLRAIAALIIRALLRIYNRFEIVGHEHLRTNRSFVIVANHSSHLDTICLLAALPLRKLHRAFPVAAADYFFKSVPRTWVATVIVNALPFARQVRVRQSLSICCRSCSAIPGNILIIFPRARDRQPERFRNSNPGIGALVADGMCRCSLLSRGHFSGLAQRAAFAASAKGSAHHRRAAELRLAQR